MKDKQIILVEDEQTVAHAVCVLIRQLGGNVVHTRSAEDAFTLMTRKRPDALVIDANLPGMSGYALCQSIASRNDIPILLMTSRRGEFEKRKATALGATGVLIKPFTAETLRNRLTHLLEEVDEA